MMSTRPNHTHPRAQRLLVRQVLPSRALTCLMFGVLGLLTVSCGKSDPKSPGIDGMGSPGISWAAKNDQQRFGFMAAVVHPETWRLFAEDDSSYKDNFTCETCHGSQPDLIDYKMPSDSLFALPKDNALEEAAEYDAEVTEFMQKKLTPEMNKLLNQGSGPKFDVTCHSCHPIDE